MVFKVWLHFIAFLVLSNSLFGESIDLSRIARSVEIAEKIQPSEALKLFDIGSGLIEGHTTFGFSENYFWILVDVPDSCDLTQNYILDVDNPHIDLINAYLVSQGRIKYLGRSGDRMPFSARTHKNRRNIFPVTFNTSEDRLLLFVDKRNASVYVPMKLWNTEAFSMHEARTGMLHGLYFGILLLIVFYSLLIFVVQRSQIYIWYMLYVASVFLYLFTHIGYGFEFLFPDQYEWNNYLRLILLISIVTTLIRFTQRFLPVRSVAPWTNRLFYVVITVLFGIVLWWILIPGLFTANTIVVINAIYGLMVLSVVLIIIAVISSWNTARSAAMFYSVAFGANVLAGFAMMFEEFGLVQLSWLPFPPVFIGMLAEVIIFAIGLSYQTKLIGDDRRKLLADINHLQQQAMQAFVRGTEEEKVRVANELHDDVASRLSLLSMKLDRDTDSELKEQIQSIKEGVRRISHQLNPVALDDETFLGMAKQLISEYQKAGMNIDFRVYDMGSVVPQEIGLQLYRVLQEALQNMQKHAKAELAEIQIFQHGKELVMTIEDDGVGFDQMQTDVGLGLKNMPLRAEQLGGEFSISSAMNEGTSIMVSVPLG